MKKIMIACSILILLLLLLASPGLADPIKKNIEVSYNNIQLIIDGTKITPKDVNGNIVEPFIYNGTTYLPVRAVGEALGKTVDWDGATQTVYIGDKPVTAEIAISSGSDFNYVRQKGKIIVGYTNYAPMNYFDITGLFTGFDTELTLAVCAKLGVKPEFVEIDWGTKEVALNAKNIDCIWNGLTITSTRKETMSITEPYIINAQVVVMRVGAIYTDTSSLVEKTVVAEKGSAGEDTIEEDAFLMNANYIAKYLQTECLLAVKAGTADAAVVDMTIAKTMTGPGTDYANLIIVDRLVVEEYGIAFRKGSDLCDKVNVILKEFRNDGTIAALANKYGLELPDLPK